MSKNSPTQGKTPEQAFRAESAALRRAAREQRSPAEQIALLDDRPGESRRERARLTKLLDKE